jgi:signal transduction histidine kinase
VWATGPNGLRWFVTPGGAATLAGPFNAQARPLFFDRSGALWRANTEGGINRTVLASGSSDGPAPTDDWLGALDGLTADDVFDIFQDREANIWVGTGGGLDLLRATALVAAPLPRNAHGSRVAADTDGAVWIGGENLELTRLHHGATSTFGVPAPIWALHRDSSGEVWVWSTGRLWRGVGGVFSRMPPAPFTGEPSAMARDRLGRLWVGVTNSGLFTFSEGRWSRATIPGLPATSGPLRVAESDSAGSAWMLFRNGTIASFAGDQITIDAGAAALGRGLAAAFAPSADRTWIGLDRGLVVVDRLGARAIAGLTESTIGRIKGVVEAANGSVWLNADRGVVQIEPAEVQRMLSVPSVAPRFRVLDYLDGGIGGAVLVPSQAAASGTDGRLWFVGFDSVVTIDPTQIPSNPLPPPVHIQTLTVAGHAYPVSDGLPLPVGTTNIQIKYTALSLTMPDRVRFRYVLEGVDGGWQEAGGRREAFYTNLSPGSYTFRVVASNNDGVWNETGATLAFEVPPAFYQTAAFRAGSVFLVLGLVWLAYRLRLRQVTGQVRDRLEERRSERERIARELHDTLLQGLQGLILKFQAIATRLPPGDATAAAIERALERADRVLIESRDRVRDLRVSTESGAELSAALAAVADELARDTTLTFQVAAEGEPRPLHPIVRDEAYWIGREALVNAFHHSKGRCVEAEVCYAASELRLRCRDDGTGIGRDALDGQSDGRWGVRGMRERARRIGASLEIRSRPNAGTEVELRVPAAAAYPGMSRSWWPRLRRVAAGGGVS